MLKFLLCFVSFASIFFTTECENVCDIAQNEDRFDCFPEQNASKEECLKRGCCWSPPIKNTKFSYRIDIPYCYYSSSFPNYKIVNSVRKNDVTSVYSLEKQNATFRPNEILKLEARIILDSKQSLRVQIVDPNNQRYQVPNTNNNFNFYDKKGNNEQEYDFQIHVSEDPFSLRVYRRSTGKLIFDTSVAPLIYADQYIEFSTSLPNDFFYGIGEHEDNFAHKAIWKSFSLWNRDVPPSLNTNLYGTHPFYLAIESDSNAMGFYFMNSNGMDVNVQPYPALTFITIGGIIDFYIYLGPTPQDIVAQHTAVVGRSLMPQYFSLGFNLCRWKYNDFKKLKEVINRNRKAEIPYDTQWTDIDAMSFQMDWTFDNTSFSELPSIVKDLHDHDQHYVNIIDPAISNKPGYYPYQKGLESDVFIKRLDNNQPLIGAVWPGTTVFPDFTNPNTLAWWADVALKFHDIIPFDGIWIDMNEPSNFLDGSTTGCTNSVYDNPPYTPRVIDNLLYAKTICTSSKQYLSNHYNLHNMYGHFEAIATNHALKIINKNKRPFVLTRSSFAGTGQYAAHWSGDNKATWDDLYYSIPIMLNFNMFGVSMVGADICGFSGDTTEELCIRWMQLGSFYPFMRNHNDDTSKDQDPAVFSSEGQEIMKKYLKMRYSLLPYIYSCFYKSYKYGETVARPLFFEFPNDKNTHYIDTQFLFGPALMISPVLEKGATIVNAYFPNTTWYKYETGKLVDNSLSPFISLEAPINEINVHIRGGYIVPFQIPSVTTKASRKNPFGLVVALHPEKESLGSLFWDDGESIDSIENGNYNLFNFTAIDGNVKVICTNSGYQTSMILSNLIIYGVSKKPVNVTINSQNYDNFIYNEFTMVLTIQHFFIDITEFDIIDFSWFF